MGLFGHDCSSRAGVSLADAPPSIESRPYEGAAPIWSVMIPTYNPTATLRETILSVHAAGKHCGAQMQLEVVDDASPGVEVSDLLASWGLSEVAYFRRARNGGLGKCWNTCIRRARGDLVHILHHDDLVRSSFYEHMGHLAQAHPEAGMLFCQTEAMELCKMRLEPLEQGHAGLIEGWLGRISARQRVQCPSVVVRRSVYEKVGGFDPSLRYVIDWEMWIRVAAATPVAYFPDALAIYRAHDRSETQRLKAAGVITEDFANALCRIDKTLSKAEYTQCRKLAFKFAISMSNQAIASAERLNRKDIAISELRTAIKRWGLKMGPFELAQHLKWYLNIVLARPNSDVSLP